MNLQEWMQKTAEIISMNPEQWESGFEVVLPTQFYGEDFSIQDLIDALEFEGMKSEVTAHVFHDFQSIPVAWILYDEDRDESRDRLPLMKV